MESLKDTSDLAYSRHLHISRVMKNREKTQTTHTHTYKYIYYFQKKNYQPGKAEIGRVWEVPKRHLVVNLY